MLDKLEGYKSYAVGVAIVAISILHGLGYIPKETYEYLLGILLGAGIVALRLGIKGKE